MKISVLCPVYNAESFIEESINSILNQTYEDFEFIICNDASTDRSHFIIDSIKDERIQYIQNDRNIGYLKTINRLFSIATSELIAFQDADDVSHNLRFEKQTDFLIENEDIALLGTNFNIIDPFGKIIRRQNMIEDSIQLSQEILKQNPFQKPSIMFRREIIEKIGGFREGFLKLKNISEDYDWLLRASQFFSFGNINYPEPLYNYRSVPSAMTKSFMNLDQLFGHDIALMLFKQRMKDGVDDLDKRNYSQISSFVNELKKPYLDDPSLFYKEKSESLMYNGLKKNAFKSAVKAFKIRPNWSNFKLLQYCFRKLTLN